MSTIRMDPEGKQYDITLKSHSLERVGELFDLDRRVLILTDDGVPKAYAGTVRDTCKNSRIVCLPAGEIHKDVEHYVKILSAMVEFNMDRRDCLVAVGGGVVGDMGGFAAATYMRGIDYYQVPTTLLAQVDSSVGGKTAMDFMGYKNLVGAFWQPKGVLIDPDVLNTLAPRQFACGMVEIIKMFAAFNEEKFRMLESSVVDIRIDSDLLKNTILGALYIKKAVVEKDAREAGLRKALNFGHTVGHGIESVSGLLHGECVGLGMLCVTKGEVRERIKTLLKRYGLPVTCRISERALTEAMQHDKKSDGDEVTVIRSDKIGSFVPERTTVKELMEESREVLELI